MAEEEAASSVLGPSISVPSPLFSHILSSHPHSTHTKTSLGHRCFVKASLFCHQEAWVLDLAQGLSGEGNGTPLQYSCLENPMSGGARRLQSMASLRVRHDSVTSLSRIGEGNGNALHCSCLENPRDGEAWWAAVYGVTQSRTRLQRLSSSITPIIFLQRQIL